jgi:hypothetical protein
MSARANILIACGTCKLLLNWLARPHDALWHNGIEHTLLAEVLVDDASGLVAAAVCNDGDRSWSEPAVSRALVEAVRINPEHRQ